MSLRITIKDDGGSRLLNEAELPLRIGSSTSADIRIPGALSSTSIALIGVLDERAFVQPTGGTETVTVDDEEITSTTWLADGSILSVGGIEVRCHVNDDQMQLEVAYPEASYQTLPPDLEAEKAAAEETITPIRTRRARTAPGGADERRRKIVQSSVYGALALLAAFAFYIFSSKPVLIETDPDYAEIEIAGGFLKLRVGGRYLLWQGDYTVTMTAAGYVSLEQEITIGSADNQEFEFHLEKLPGRITITTRQLVSGEVWIDGELIGETPTDEFPLKAGSYELRIRAERYLEFIQLLEVEGRDVQQTLEAELVPGWANVSFSTVPPGATISADGDELGQTPDTVEIMAGLHELLLYKPGYKEWRQPLTVVANQPEEFANIQLEEADSILSVASSPTGAAVTVDGRFRGTTPLSVELSKGASYAIRLTKAGYEVANRAIDVDDSKDRSLTIELRPRIGIVTIVSDPPDAELIVDGRRRGNASQELRLTATAHRIEIRKNGFEPFVIEVTPKPGFPQYLEVNLLTPEEAVLASMVPVITTSQGMSMRLIQPGAFMMGAPRRQQGRRANEVQRSVELTRYFYISVQEVTNRDFREFRPTHTSGAERYRELAADRHPAVFMSWKDAALYCNWLSNKEGLSPAYKIDGRTVALIDPPTTGYRLPTEAEWVWVARYSGVGEAHRYPWGDSMPPARNSGNYADISAEVFVDAALSVYDDGYPLTAPVGKFPPNPAGIYDLGGNVAEWVHDVYVVNSTFPGQAEVDPVGPDEGQYRVIRGSGWRHSTISQLRVSYRDFGDRGRLDVGFRIARYADTVMK
ncbi:MAG: PEGA domain-containing protein [Gammaproteobacteria bacterium]|nr:PEGA domain-containing protein [Gammaproteobacteria bacterium]